MEKRNLSYGDNLKLFRLDSYDEKLFQDIVDLANKSFGDGYMSLKSLKAMYGKQTSLYVTIDGATLCGYAINFVIDFDEAAEKLKLPRDIWLHLKSRSQHPCFIKSLAVHPQYRGGTLAERLFAVALEDSRRLGADSSICSAWKVGNKIPMNHILVKAGFRKIMEIPNLWYDDEGYICSVCNDRCTCVAAVYFLGSEGVRL